MTQYCLWNTFGPIADTVKKGFHWSNADIATLANWDPIIYVFTAMQICWVVEKKGKITFDSPFYCGLPYDRKSGYYAFT